MDRVSFRFIQEVVALVECFTLNRTCCFPHPWSTFSQENKDRRASLEFHIDCIDWKVFGCGRRITDGLTDEDRLDFGEVDLRFVANVSLNLYGTPEAVQKMHNDLDWSARMKVYKRCGRLEEVEMSNFWKMISRPLRGARLADPLAPTLTDFCPKNKLSIRQLKKSPENAEFVKRLFAIQFPEYNLELISVEGFEDEIEAFLEHSGTINCVCIYGSTKITPRTVELLLEKFHARMCYNWYSTFILKCTTLTLSQAQRFLKKCTWHSRNSCNWRIKFERRFTNIDDFISFFELAKFFPGIKVDDIYVDAVCATKSDHRDAPELYVQRNSNGVISWGWNVAL
ncbi:hypothetical protein QR680_008184 [Steinernema hermaphroditum]|uniref:Uncharacterized protein n=1 Tax=Steinernema hermaphroditum TaxID=289476 RepID=A0AA39II27_9BILA|nr:hypothetical protein QR680_008184 [Steinernema hermaphroditum]